MALQTVPALRRCCGPDCAEKVAATSFDEAAISRQVAAFHALGDETRMKMVHLLSRHESLCVCEIEQAFDLGQPTVSHHLKVLRDAGLVDVRRVGTWAYYVLRKDALKALVGTLLAVI